MLRLGRGDRRSGTEKGSRDLEVMQRGFFFLGEIGAAEALLAKMGAVGLRIGRTPASSDVSVRAVIVVGIFADRGCGSENLQCPRRQLRSWERWDHGGGRGRLASVGGRATGERGG